MTIRQILERRAAIRAELATIHAAHPDALPADVQTRWTALEAEAANLTAQEARQATLDDLDRRAAGHTVAGTGDNRFDAQAAQVNILDVIRAQMGATDAGAGRAREVSAELARRSGRQPEGLLFHMGVSGASAEQRTLASFGPAAGPGGNLIPTNLSPNLIDRLRERVMVRRMGATVLGGLTGNLSIPRLKASATAQWVGGEQPDHGQRLGLRSGFTHAQALRRHRGNVPQHASAGQPGRDPPG